MGLDMYLQKKVFPSINYKKEQEDIRFEVVIYDQNKKTGTFTTKSTSSYTIGETYWRKANAIHDWFVENIQDGQDDCERYEVDGEMLTELKQLCKKILEEKAEHGIEPAIELAQGLLPTSEGFFFGDTDYSEYYFHTLEETIEQLEELEKIKIPTNIEGAHFIEYYEYQSSW